MITSLPLDLWPAQDRAAWCKACEPGRKWRRGGAASHLVQSTRDDLQRRYGYFLEARRERDALDLQAPPGGLVTRENVDLYVERVRSGWSSVTLAQSIWKLSRVANVLAPVSDFDWLQELAKDLDLVADPKDRFDRIVNIDVLIRAGMALVTEARISHRRRPIWRAGMMRDGLMMAMLAYHPIRLKNFSELSLGRTFVRDGSRWTINLPGSDVKNGRPDLRVVRERLNSAIALYLTWARPRLMRRPADFVIGDGHETAYPSGPLWIGQYGEALSYNGVEKRIVETTRLTDGKALSPHDFRRCAAFSARYHAGSKPYMASGVLQHVGPDIVDENYNLASSLEVASEFADWIEEIAGG